jgi:hypothetical protein
MIGVVNAIGASQAARGQPATQTQGKLTPAELGEPPMWVRTPEPTPSAAESTQAVRPVEFEQAMQERHLPDETDGDEASRLETARKSGATVGTLLDTSA